MPPCTLPRPWLRVAAVLAATLLPAASHAQLPPVLDPGAHHVFIGADVDADLGPGCDGVINGCGVDYGDLGASSPRMYIVSGVNAGVLGTTRTATGRLAHSFSVAPGPDHRIGAKLIGVVSWRGWLQASVGAYDNNSSSEIGVAIYDVSDGVSRILVGSQTIHTSSVGGQLSLATSFTRDIGRGGFALSVNLERGHHYLVAVEATCTSTSGLIGLATAASYSTYDGISSVLTDGYVEQTSMAITLDPDYLELIDELREDFENHTHGYLTGRGVGHNNADAVTSGPIEAPTTTPDDVAGAIEAPALSVTTAAPDRVEFTARVPPGAHSPTLERRTGDTEWLPVAAVPDGGRVVDATVSAGTRYGYRVRVGAGDSEALSEELWVEVPAQVSFGLEGARPNPIAGSFRVTFMLPRAAPATLSLHDIQGRAVQSREVGGMGIGRHTVEWASGEPLANGIYLLRLTQEGRSVATQVAVLK